MKKKLPGILLCLSMLALTLSMLTLVLSGCSAKTKEDNDANDKTEAYVNNEEDAEITKKPEKQYAERMEAYMEYYKQVRNEYSNYQIGATITLDDERLPLLWLMFHDASNDKDNTQLISYDNGKAVILAERGECIIPLRGSKLIMAVGERGEYKGAGYYMYDKEKQDFIIADDLLDIEPDSDVIYSEKELEEKLELLTDILECTNCFDTMKICINKSKGQAAYLGKVSKNMYEAMAMLGVIDGVYMSIEDESMDGIYLRSAYADNKTVLSYFEQLPDAYLSESEMNNVFKRYGEDMYSDIVKAIPSGIFTFPDGSECTPEASEKYINCISIFKYDSDWYLEGGEAGEYFQELDAERIMRGLQKNPIYSQEELFLYIVSAAYNCEIIEVDLNDYILSKAPDKYIAGVVRSYVRGRNVADCVTSELMNNQKALMKTEPYNTIKEEGVDETTIEENVVTLLCYDGNEYQFQIEFNEAGDRISKISYIDPYASLPEWKQVYLNKLDMSEVWYPSLTDINSDGVPEIVASVDEGGSSSSWVMYYIDKSDNIQYISVNYCGNMDYNDSKIFVSGGRTGVYFDTVYSYNTVTGIYDCVLDGQWCDNDAFTSEGYDKSKVIYQIDGVTVSGDEYKERVEEAISGITNNFHSEDTSADTDIASLIMKY